MRNESLGQRIKRLRLAKGWLQKELAYKARTAAGSIVNIEHDRHAPNVWTAAEIARALGVTLDYLVYGTQTDQTGK